MRVQYNKGIGNAVFIRFSRFASREIIYVFRVILAMCPVLFYYSVVCSFSKGGEKNESSKNWSVYF